MGSTTNDKPGGMDTAGTTGVAAGGGGSDATPTTTPTVVASGGIGGATTPVTFDDFAKLDIRVGTIVEADAVPKSDKLLRLQVSFGPIGKRTILAGIGKSYKPADLTGRQVAAIVNFPPRAMMGIQSEGMLLAAESTDGGVTLLGFTAGAVEGAKIG